MKVLITAVCAVLIGVSLSACLTSSRHQAALRPVERQEIRSLGSKTVAADAPVAEVMALVHIHSTAPRLSVQRASGNAASSSVRP
jgi:hypothetical protein